MKKLRTFGWAAVLSLAALYAGWWASSQWFTEGADAGQPAADFTLNDLHGQPQKLSAYRGKLVLVNFWATWCAPCIEELPLLVEAQKNFGPRGLQILGPAMDDVQSAQPIAQRFGINYPVMADYASVDAVMRTLGNEAGALPYSVLIDGQGRVIRSILGGLKREDLQRIADDHLAS